MESAKVHRFDMARSTRLFVLLVLAHAFCAVLIVFARLSPLMGMLIVGLLGLSAGRLGYAWHKRYAPFCDYQLTYHDQTQQWHLMCPESYEMLPVKLKSWQSTPMGLALVWTFLEPRRQGTFNQQLFRFGYFPSGRVSMVVGSDQLTTRDYRWLKVILLRAPASA